MIFFAALVIFAAPSFLDPQIHVVNRTADGVWVAARWRGNEKIIGRMEPGSAFRFSVDDEAAIVFQVRYADGREIDTAPLYFTSGINVIAEITPEGVEVRYSHEK